MVEVIRAAASSNIDARFDLNQPFVATCPPWSVSGEPELPRSPNAVAG
jgi:hypothetical protein